MARLYKYKDHRIVSQPKAPMHSAIMDHLSQVAAVMGMVKPVARAM
jgi:hypothetical protein